MFLLQMCARRHTWASRSTYKNQVRNCNSNSYSTHGIASITSLIKPKIASQAIILVSHSQTTRFVIEDYLTSHEHFLSELATSIPVINSLKQPDNVIVRSWNKLETSLKTDCIDKNSPTWTCSNFELIQYSNSKNQPFSSKTQKQQVINIFSFIPHQN